MGSISFQLILGCLFSICIFCHIALATDFGRVLSKAARDAIDELDDPIERIPRKQISVLRYIEEGFAMFYSHIKIYPLTKLTQNELDDHLAPSDEPRIHETKKTTVGVVSDGMNAGNIIANTFLLWSNGEQVALWCGRASTDAEIENELNMKWEAETDKLKQKQKRNEALTPDERLRMESKRPRADVNAEKQRRENLSKEARKLNGALKKLMKSHGVPIYEKNENDLCDEVQPSDTEFFAQFSNGGIKSIGDGRNGAGLDGLTIYAKAYRASNVVKYLDTLSEGKIWQADISSFLKTYLFDTKDVISDTLKKRLDMDKKYITLGNYTTAINGFAPEHEKEMPEGKYFLGVPKQIHNLIKLGEKQFAGLKQFNREHTVYVFEHTEKLTAKIKENPGSQFFAKLDSIKDLHTDCFKVEEYHYPATPKV